MQKSFLFIFHKWHGQPFGFELFVDVADAAVFPGDPYRGQIAPELAGFVFVCLNDDLFAEYQFAQPIPSLQPFRARVSPEFRRVDAVEPQLGIVNPDIEAQVDIGRNGVAVVNADDYRFIKIEVFELLSSEQKAKFQEMRKNRGPRRDKGWRKSMDRGPKSEF